MLQTSCIGKPWYSAPVAAKRCHHLCNRPLLYWQHRQRKQQKLQWKNGTNVPINAHASRNRLTGTYLDRDNITKSTDPVPSGAAGSTEEAGDAFFGSRQRVQQKR